MRCLTCGAELSPIERFCGSCGAGAPAAAPASTPRHCGECGSALNPGEQFCGTCGQPSAPASPSATLCAACGAPLPPDTRFCGECGQVVAVAQPSALRCHSCQAELAPEERFCGACGQTVGEPVGEPVLAAAIAGLAAAPPPPIQMAASPPAVPARSRQRRWPRMLLTAGGTLLLVLIGLGVLGSLNRPTQAPAAQVATQPAPVAQPAAPAPAPPAAQPKVTNAPLTGVEEARSPVQVVVDAVLTGVEVAVSLVREVASAVITGAEVAVNTVRSMTGVSPPAPPVASKASSGTGAPAPAAPRAAAPAATAVAGTLNTPRVVPAGAVKAPTSITPSTVATVVRSASTRAPVTPMTRSVAATAAPAAKPSLPAATPPATTATRPAAPAAATPAAATPSPTVAPASTPFPMEDSIVLFSDSFDGPDADRCALGQTDLAFGGSGTYFYLPIWPTGGSDSTNPLGASLRGGALVNNGLDFGGVQFAAAADACANPGTRGTDIGQDFYLQISLLVPGGPNGESTQAGPYFRSRAAARGDGIFGGDSAGYWVKLWSDGQIRVVRLDSGQVVAASGPIEGFASDAFHSLELAVQGNTSQVVLDGHLVLFNLGGPSSNEVPVPATAGSNNGTVGIAFSAEDFRGQVGGQRADNLLVTRYQPFVPAP